MISKMVKFGTTIRINKDKIRTRLFNPHKTMNTMFDELLFLVHENAGETIIHNKSIPGKRKNEALNATAHSIMDILKKEIQSGDINKVKILFSGKNSAIMSSTLSSNMQQRLVDKFTQRFQLSDQEAGSIAETVIPKVLVQLVKKANDSEDGKLKLNSMIIQLGGLNNEAGADGKTNDEDDFIKNMFGS